MVSSWVKDIIGRTDSGKCFHHNHVSGFAYRTFAGVKTSKPHHSLPACFGKLEDVGSAFEVLHLLFIAAGKNTVIAYLDKTTRQDVHGKATQELHNP